MNTDLTTTYLPIGVPVICRDGPAGRVSHAVVDPRTAAITHFVAQVLSPMATRHTLPVDDITSIDEHGVHINSTRHKINQQPHTNLTDYIRTVVRHFDTEPRSTLIMPYVLPSQPPATANQTGLPLQTLAIRRGAYLVATDGQLGVVDELLVHPQRDECTHLIARHGHVWGQRELAVPVSAVSIVRGKIVKLGLSRKDVGLLPTIAVTRRWR